MNQAGIPKNITLEFASHWVGQRVSAKRYLHIKGVAKVAAELALLSGVDAFLAELAGWLHDACKELKSKELVQKAQEYGMTLDPILSRHGHLLHGPVAAQVARRELKVTNEDLLAAIAEHTLGAAPMSELSKLVFLADCLEENRPQDYTQPIWSALKQNDKLNLNQAIVVAAEAGLKQLILDGKPIHPKTVEVRNYYLDLLNET